MSDLGSVLLGDPNDGADRVPTLRTGVVTQVAPPLVRVGSATTAQTCSVLGSYAPRVNDVVSVLVVSGDRLVLGSVRPPAGTVLWQQSEVVSFSSFINGVADVNYADTAPVFSFATVAHFEATGIYQKPDRNTTVQALVYSNSQTDPSAAAGTLYDSTGQITSGGATWTFLYGSLVASMPLAASAGGPTWTMRHFNGAGGVVPYDIRFNLLMTRVAA